MNKLQRNRQSVKIKIKNKIGGVQGLLLPRSCHYRTFHRCEQVLSNILTPNRAFPYCFRLTGMLARCFHKIRGGSHSRLSSQRSRNHFPSSLIDPARLGRDIGVGCASGCGIGWGS